jgi:EAL domain-containing protein (putative c-di-GMP-specific phosphodiesterase class I)
VVENSGVIRELTEAVLDMAVADAAAWRRRGHQLSVAVNVSVRNLLDEEFPTRVAATLARHGLPGELLTLEITETVALVELETVEHTLARLRELNLSLSVDDFGTGYSSLRFLQRIAVNEVKIDRSFTMQMTQDEGAYAIVAATIELAHRLGLQTVAEGVETEEELTAIRLLGCDEAQGYYIGKPMPIEDLMLRLESAQTTSLGPAQPLGELIPFQRPRSDGADEADEVTA